MSISMRGLADYLLATGQLDERNAESFVATIHDAARQGRFAMTLSMFAVAASAPT